LLASRKVGSAEPPSYVSNPLGLPPREASLRPRQENWLRFAKKRRRRFLTLLFWRLPKTKAGSATVFVDELHASFLEGAFYYLESRSTWLAPLLFEMVDRHDGNARSISQVLLAPT
jgi:hypothetical protein